MPRAGIDPGSVDDWLILKFSLVSDTTQPSWQNIKQAMLSLKYAHYYKKGTIV